MCICRLNYCLLLYTSYTQKNFNYETNTPGWLCPMCSLNYLLLLYRSIPTKNLPYKPDSLLCNLPCLMDYLILWSTNNIIAYERKKSKCLCLSSKVWKLGPFIQFKDEVKMINSYFFNCFGCPHLRHNVIDIISMIDHYHYLFQNSQEIACNS